MIPAIPVLTYRVAHPESSVLASPPHHLLLAEATPRSSGPNRKQNSLAWAPSLSPPETSAARVKLGSIARAEHLRAPRIPPGAPMRSRRIPDGPIRPVPVAHRNLPRR